MSGEETRLFFTDPVPSPDREKPGFFKLLIFVRGRNPAFFHRLSCFP
ncbi:Uncharacterized protein dnm_045630 [Desulfonema magnum]|uniref:Uncharacterized protein n=1 Tax=Desulfonema magnum TaxID=45655 RepID=A0A975BNI3_9BACT|nr:Uncharacterized protein dnm_045630 [Desulfonema magnum]